MWGEFIPTVNSMNLKIYPRLAAYAEAGWTQSSNKDYNRFLNVLDAFLKKWKQEGIISKRIVHGKKYQKGAYWVNAPFSLSAIVGTTS